MKYKFLFFCVFLNLLSLEAFSAGVWGFLPRNWLSSLTSQPEIDHSTIKPEYRVLKISQETLPKELNLSAYFLKEYALKGVGKIQIKLSELSREELKSLPEIFFVESKSKPGEIYRFKRVLAIAFDADKTLFVHHVYNDLQVLITHIKLKEQVGEWDKLTDEKKSELFSKEIEKARTNKKEITEDENFAFGSRERIESLKNFLAELIRDSYDPMILSFGCEYTMAYLLKQTGLEKTFKKVIGRRTLFADEYRQLKDSLKKNQYINKDDLTYSLLIDDSVENLVSMGKDKTGPRFFPVHHPKTKRNPQGGRGLTTTDLTAIKRLLAEKDKKRIIFSIEAAKALRTKTLE